MAVRRKKKPLWRCERKDSEARQLIKDSGVRVLGVIQRAKSTRLDILGVI